MILLRPEGMAVIYCQNILISHLIDHYELAGVILGIDRAIQNFKFWINTKSLNTQIKHS